MNNLPAKNRLKLEMNMVETLYTIAGFNPGAMAACIAILRDYEKIDPDAALGGMSVLMDFDAMGIYEDKVWDLWRYVCGQNIVNVAALFRAYQLGLLGVNEERIQLLIYTRRPHMNMANIISAVKERLPNFKT